MVAIAAFSPQETNGFAQFSTKEKGKTLERKKNPRKKRGKTKKNTETLERKGERDPPFHFSIPPNLEGLGTVTVAFPAADFCISIAAMGFPTMLEPKGTDDNGGSTDILKKTWLGDIEEKFIRSGFQYLATKL